MHYSILIIYCISQKFCKFFGFIVMRHMSRIIKAGKCLFISLNEFIIFYCCLIGSNTILFAMNKMDRDINAFNLVKQIKSIQLRK